MRVPITGIVFAFLLSLPLQASTIIPPTAFITGASVNPSGPNWVFELLFSRAPDLLTVDGYGRHADSFQWYLTDDFTAVRPMSSVADFIIRGDEIAQTGKVTLCTTRPFGGGCPGGWGWNMGPIPLFWGENKTSLSFVIPESALGSRTFAYDVLSFQYGAQNDAFTGNTDGGDATRWGPLCPILQPNCYGTLTVAPPVDTKPPEKTPEPGSWLLLMVGVVGIVLFKGRLG